MKRSALNSSFDTFYFPTDFPRAAGGRRACWEAVFSPRGLRGLRLLGDEKPAPRVSDSRVKNLQRKIVARMNGKRADIDWNELDFSGHADFHQRVWKAMQQIPFGETATYAEVADAAGSPMAFRACGQACGANPVILFVPCHRVVASNGLGGFGCGLDIKKDLLRLEGVDWRQLGKMRREPVLFS
jgi:O-6-methylguanine DNA methyltransferase